MAKKMTQREEKFHRLLEANRYHTPTSKPSQFYALVDVREEVDNGDGTKSIEDKTYVIGGSSRSDARNNAETFMEIRGFSKGRIAGIYPVR